MVTKPRSRASRLPGLPRQVVARLFVAGVLAYLFLPVVVTVLFSFTTSPRLSLPIEGLTLDWYRRALANSLLVAAMRNSLILAALTAVVAGALGVAFAFGIVRLSSRSREAMTTASLLPAGVPALVFGVALAVFFSTIGRPQGLANAAVGHVVVALPFVVLTMNARLATFDFSVLEAARDLGASPFRTFRDVTLPLVRPSIVGAGLLSMALSLDEFVVTWFNIGTQQSLPVLVWGLLRRGINPSINALATLVLAGLVGLVVLSYLTSRGRRW